MLIFYITSGGLKHVVLSLGYNAIGVISFTVKAG